MLQSMITTTKVHSTIQEMNKNLSVDDEYIPIGAIAQGLHVEPNELLAHIETLAALYYLKYTDKKKDTIKLTFSGKNTVVPIH
ncbi:MAG: hypothetical protein JWQ38_1793 [Flavipsychrobacter sp.]|nr:hypothetical protein [Flavipsychrobacter sp.]